MGVLEVCGNTSAEPDRAGGQGLATAELAMHLSTGQVEGELLRHKRADVLVFRAHLAGHGQVIVKLWQRKGLKEALRFWLGRSEPWREAQALRRLNAVGAAAPTLIDDVRLRGPKVRHTHAIIVEDLGRCVRLVEHVAELAADGQMDRIEKLEAQIIAITSDMINAGVLDLDHSLNNMLVPPNGTPMRVDLEYAVCCSAPLRRPRLFGTMLGRIIGTYIFAVHPRTERVSDFVTHLYDRVRPPQGIRRHARAYVLQMLGPERRPGGQLIEVDLPV